MVRQNKSTAYNSLLNTLSCKLISFMHVLSTSWRRSLPGEMMLEFMHAEIWEKQVQGNNNVECTKQQQSVVHEMTLTVIYWIHIAALFRDA